MDEGIETPESIRLRKVRLGTLAEDFLRDYRINGQKSYGHAEARWKQHLRPFFGDCPASAVTSSRISEYVDARQAEDAANATINRELAALRRMFNLAYQATPPKVTMVPHFPMLRENNIRTGFLTDELHTKLANGCAMIGLWLRAAFELGCTWGWRRTEVIALRVERVDLAEGTIRLNTGSTKNKDGRVAKMPKQLRELIAQCVYGKAPEDFVFTREDGKAVKDFRKVWRNVAKAAGVPGLLFHDLRRTAARNLRRIGVQEGTIMKIGGWRTRSMFDRYNIIDQSDIDDAMRKLDAKQAAEQPVVEAQKNSTENSTKRVQ